VLIRHEDFTYGLYLHLKFKGVKVKLGNAVKQGQSIAASGNSGTTSGPHLHFAVLVPNGQGPLESVEFKFRDKRNKPVRPQESKRPSEWVGDEMPSDSGDTPLIQDDL
jgi:murein DD-endopeptidase MepM/ murein hydrolase activator NlpD